MSNTRFVFFVILAAALGFIWTIMSKPTPQPGADGQPAQHSEPLPAGMIEILVASSSTKQAWMEKVAANFQAAGSATASGQKIRVKVQSVSSGGSMDAILNGKLKPAAWSPGSDSWYMQLDEDWQRRHNRVLHSEACQPTIYTPLGFALWRPMAEALGWPDKPIGWKTIVDLAADPKGWERYGHPEWGKFRFGHAHPKYGNSGLLSMTSFVYGVAGKTSNLTARDVYAPEVEQAMRTLQQNTAKYGTVTEDLIEMMVKHGPSYLHAIVTYESDTVATNIKRANELRFPLAFIFPAEGAFWGDHPYCVLDKADWVTPEQAEAAKLFLNFARNVEQQALAVDSMMRPLDAGIALHAPLDLSNGTDPRVTPQTVPPQATPGNDVSQAVIDLFMLTKRKATILLALDVSGSMEGAKIRAATVSSADFLKHLHPEDRVGALTFSAQVLPLAEVKRVADTVESLAGRVSNLLAGGNTALHQAVCDGVRQLENQRRLDMAAGENRLYGLIVLSDGDDTVGRPSQNEMFATCLPANAEADGVKVFPIAFGADANKDVLKRIADVSGGAMFSADPGTIDKIYLKISAEQ
jgi:Ca-activated chloride channel family protein